MRSSDQASTSSSGSHCEVHPLHGLGALADQGETALGVGVDQLGALGGASQRMPNQANGYSRQNCRRCAARGSAAGRCCANRRRRPGAAARLVAGAVRVGEADAGPVGRRGRRPRCRVTPKRTSPPSRVAGVGEVEEDVGLRVQPHRGPDQAWKSNGGAARRSAARCPRGRGRRAAPGPRHRCRRAAGRCRPRGCRRCTVFSISTRLRWSTTTESIPARCSRCDSIRPAGPPPTMATSVVVLRWTVGGDMGSIWEPMPVVRVDPHSSASA